MTIAITLTDEHAEQYLENAVEFQKFMETKRIVTAATESPKDRPATAALSTAVAVPLPTAPVVGMDTSTEQTSAFDLLAQNLAPAAPTVAVPPASPAPAVSNTGTLDLTSPPPGYQAFVAAVGVNPPPIVPIQPKLDKDGLPWDTRIHSSTQAITKDGSWRAKRGVTPEMAAPIIAEIRAVMNLPVPKQEQATILWPHAPGYVAPAPVVSAPATPTPVPVPPAPVPPAPVPPPPIPAAATITLPAVVVPAPPFVPAAPVATVSSTSTTLPAPAGTAPTASPSSLTFPGLVAKITASGIPNETVMQVLASVGIPSVPMIAARPDMIPTIASALGLA